MNQHINGETTKYVYKTMKYGKNVDDYHIEQQRRDSLVMERTSGSKFIPDIWGYCSLVRRFMRLFRYGLVWSGLNNSCITQCFLSLVHIGIFVVANTYTHTCLLFIMFCFSGSNDGFHARGKYARLHQRIPHCWWKQIASGG